VDTVEHGFQAAKTLDKGQQDHVLSCPTPAGAKRAVRRVTLRKDWNSVRLRVMLTLVRAKFTQNPDLAAKLLATGDAALIEGNTWGDRFWGVCDGHGDNHLGKILMQVRHELRQ